MCKFRIWYAVLETIYFLCQLTQQYNIWYINFGSCGTGKEIGHEYNFHSKKMLCPACSNIEYNTVWTYDITLFQKNLALI